MKKLKIAQIAPPWISVPPKKYGGTELVISHLTEELVRRGHQVTLFASGDSVTKAKLFNIYSDALFKKGILWNDTFHFLLHASASFEEADKFDIIHNHFSYWGLVFSPFVKIPIVTTYHGDFTSVEKNPIKRRIFERFRKNNFISISNSQRKFSKLNLNFIATVYNGVKIEDFKFSAKNQNYLVWLGRITEKKGVVEAIQVAKKAKLPLKIAAKVDKTNLSDVEFYKKKVKPLIDGRQIQYLGEVNSAKKNNLLRNASALLNPIKWDEPFGLVMSEAMVCGTPVIAFNRGSVSEIVKDGKTGFVVPQFDKNKKTNIKGLVDAIKKIDKIDRWECRKRVEENFTVERMVDEYEKVYKKLLKK